MLKRVFIILMCCFCAQQSYAGLGSNETKEERAKKLGQEVTRLVFEWRGNQGNAQLMIEAIKKAEEIHTLLGDQIKVEYIEHLTFLYYEFWYNFSHDIIHLKKAYNHGISILGLDKALFAQFVCAIAFDLYKVDKQPAYLENAKRACDIYVAKYPTLRDANFCMLFGEVYYHVALQNKTDVETYKKSLMYCKKALEGDLSQEMKVVAQRLKPILEKMIWELLSAELD